MRRALLISSLLLIAGLAAAAAWLLASEPALHWAIGQAQARIAGSLTFGNVSGRLSGPITIDNLDYRSESTRVNIEHISLDWRPWALLYGRLHLTEAHVTGVTIELTADLKKEPRQPWRLPIAIRIDDGELTNLLVRRGTTEWIAIDSVDIAAGADESDLALSHLRIAAPRFTVTASGALASDAGVRVDWRAQLPNLPALAGHGTLKGELRQWQMQQRITEPVAATIDADIDLRQADPRFKARVALVETALNRIVSTWPEIELTGHLDAHGTMDDFESTAQALVAYRTERLHVDAHARHSDKTFALTKLEARRPHGSGRLDAEGRYVYANAPAQLALRLTWRDWLWPGLAAIPMASDGTAQIDGTLTDYRLQAQASFGGKTLPSARLNLALHGDANAIAIDKFSLNTLDGVVAVHGAVERAPWRWQLRMRGEDLNPGSHWPAWPGQLAFNASARGSTGGKGMHNELSLTSLSGTLRGHNVAMSGRWVTTGTRHDISDTVLRVGSAEAHILGNIGRAWDLTAQASVPNLGALVPDAGGSAQAQARLTGPRATPRWDASLSAARLRYKDNAIDTLTATLHLDLSNRERSNLDATANSLRYGSRRIERVQLIGRGLVDDHRLSLQLKTPETALSADLHGKYADRSWIGRIASVSVSAPYGTWSLPEPAPLRIHRAGVVAGPLCLQASGAGRACGEVAWSTTGSGRAKLRATALPLAWLNPLLPASLRLHGTVEAMAEARFEAKRPISANVEFKTASAEIQPRHGDETLAVKRGNGRLRLDENGLHTNLDFVLAQDDTVGADITLPRFSPRAAAGAEQPLTGRVHARLGSLARVGLFLPDLEMPRGRIDVDFRLAGTLANPTLRGAATLTDASANVPVLGIRVRKVNLRARGDGGRTLQLDGRAASGPGELTLDGNLRFDAASAWRANLRINGERLEVANISQAWALASPDVQIAARPGWMRLQGSVNVPEAKLTPKAPENPISPSGDVVIVNTPEARTAPRDGWAVESQVRITLGDKVAFDGFGLTGNITGSLVAVDTPERLTTARGELRIQKGKYEAYGRKLEVERGRLLFAGGPIDNPGIDARAVRRVDEITAGIGIGGTLKSPTLSLFSDPTLSESDTLSYLLFGRPLESTSGTQGRTLASAATALKLAGGERLAERLAARFGIEEVGIESGDTSEEAALVLGKYLSPRLYINYSIGLFDQVNVLRLRYQLTTRWALQVESGTYAGADLLYTIER